MISPPLAQRLFARLAGPASGTGYRPFHSGARLASELGVSRSAVWKAAAALRQLGVGIQALPRQGYRLQHATDLLDAERISALLPASTRARLREGQCLWRTQSTNADLLARPALTPGQFDFLTSEYQDAGRGRRGRRWLTPPGGGICLSFSWAFESLPPQASALSLAIGVAGVAALAQQGVEGVRLKWPNDLVSAQGKLGGILIEMKSEAGGPTQVVIGIGLNVALDDSSRAEVAATGNRATDLTALGAAGIERSALTAALLERGVETLLRFESQGFEPFLADFLAADCLNGKPVHVTGGLQTQHGVARGVDEIGALLLETAEGMRRIVSGEVTVRPQ